jgi:hypothetical protein
MVLVLEFVPAATFVLFTEVVAERIELLRVV